MNFNQLVVLLIVGAIAGTLTGHLVAMKKGGLGLWANLGVGMAGALIGGAIFSLFDIGAGLKEIKVTLRDIVAACVGSLLFIAIWWIVNKSKKKPT